MNKLSSAEEALRQMLYDNGYTDAMMADVLDIDIKKIKDWRHSRGLEPNRVGQCARFCRPIKPGFIIPTRKGV